MKIKPLQANISNENQSDCDGFNEYTYSQMAEEDKFVDELARAIVFIAKSIVDNK